MLPEKMDPPPLVDYVRKWRESFYTRTLDLLKADSERPDQSNTALTDMSKARVEDLAKQVANLATEFAATAAKEKTVQDIWRLYLELSKGFKAGLKRVLTSCTMLSPCAQHKLEIKVFAWVDDAVDEYIYELYKIEHAEELAGKRPTLEEVLEMMVQRWKVYRTKEEERLRAIAKKLQRKVL